MRYYFDIRDDHYAADDQEGTELGGNDAAWQEAIKTATMIAGDVNKLRPRRLMQGQVAKPLGRN
jgi:hypothetical protein